MGGKKMGERGTGRKLPVPPPDNINVEAASSSSLPSSRSRGKAASTAKRGKSKGTGGGTTKKKLNPTRGNEGTRGGFQSGRSTRTRRSRNATAKYNEDSDDDDDDKEEDECGNIENEEREEVMEDDMENEAVEDGIEDEEMEDDIEDEEMEDDIEDEGMEEEEDGDMEEDNSLDEYDVYPSDSISSEEQDTNSEDGSHDACTNSNMQSQDCTQDNDEVIGISDGQSLAIPSSTSQKRKRASDGDEKKENKDTPNKKTCVNPPTSSAPTHIQPPPAPQSTQQSSTSTCIVTSVPPPWNQTMNSFKVDHLAELWKLDVSTPVYERLLKSGISVKSTRAVWSFLSGLVQIKNEHIDVIIEILLWDDMIGPWKFAVGLLLVQYCIGRDFQEMLALKSKIANHENVCNFYFSVLNSMILYSVTKSNHEITHSPEFTSNQLCKERINSKIIEQLRRDNNEKSLVIKEFIYDVIDEILSAQMTVLESDFADDKKSYLQAACSRYLTNALIHGTGLGPFHNVLRVSRLNDHDVNCIPVRLANGTTSAFKIHKHILLINDIKKETLLRRWDIPCNSMATIHDIVELLYSLANVNTSIIVITAELVTAAKYLGATVILKLIKQGRLKMFEETAMMTTALVKSIAVANENEKIRVTEMAKTASKFDYASRIAFCLQLAEPEFKKLLSCPALRLAKLDKLSLVVRWILKAENREICSRDLYAIKAAATFQKEKYEHFFELIKPELDHSTFVNLFRLVMNGFVSHTFLTTIMN